MLVAANAQVWSLWGLARRYMVAINPLVEVYCPSLTLHKPKVARGGEVVEHIGSSSVCDGPQTTQYPKGIENLIGIFMRQ